MFIDEGYSFISEAYVGKFFEFVKMLCEQKGLALIMISHDDRFSGYADKCYGVLNGRIYSNTNQSYQEFKSWLKLKQQDIQSMEIEGAN
jgi:energy-coupling factor transporter ATP-binding protein EcfA2